MKTCIHCGAALPDDARFCHKCAGAQGPKRKAGGPFPWRRTAALVVPLLTLLYLLTAFRKPVEALPPTTEESTEPTAAETAESPTPTESRAPTVRRNPSHFTEVKTKEEDGWDYHATYTKMGDTFIEATFTYSNGKVEQVILRLDGTRRSDYQYYAKRGIVEYMELYPNGKWSFHVGGSIGSGATASSYDENGNVTESEWVDDAVSYIEERRLKVDDVIEEYTQEILDNWDDSLP